MKQLGYYAMCKATKNLFQYEWGADDEFSIMNSDGDFVMKDPNKYEILEIFHSVASCCLCEKSIEDEDEVKRSPFESSLTYCKECYTNDEHCQEWDGFKVM